MDHLFWRATLRQEESIGCVHSLLIQYTHLQQGNNRSCQTLQSCLSPQITRNNPNYQQQKVVTHTVECPQDGVWLNNLKITFMKIFLKNEKNYTQKTTESRRMNHSAPLPQNQFTANPVSLGCYLSPSRDFTATINMSCDSFSKYNRKPVMGACYSGT